MERALIVRLLCVSLLAAVMLPIGNLAFPLFSDVLSGMQFQAIEAIIVASVGFGISAVIA